MWPSNPEAQAYAVLMLAAVLVIVGLLWTLRAERRHLLGKLSRQGERAQRYRAEAELARRVPTFDEHVATTPTLVKPFTAPTGSWPAIASVVVGDDPDATTRIYVGDDGRDMT